MPKGLAPGEAGFSVIIDPTEWYRFKQRADEVGAKDIPRILRKRIKAAGEIGVRAVKEELAKSSPDSGPDTHAGRNAIAAATRVTVSFSSRSAGVRIVSSAAKLSPAHKALLQVYNREDFRHPVFERKDQHTARQSQSAQYKRDRKSGKNPNSRANWVVQHGRPYFGAAILKVLDGAIYNEIIAALDDAGKALASRTGA